MNGSLWWLVRLADNKAASVAATWNKDSMIVWARGSEDDRGTVCVGACGRDTDKQVALRDAFDKSVKSRTCDVWQCAEYDLSQVTWQSCALGFRCRVPRRTWNSQSDHALQAIQSIAMMSVLGASWHDVAFAYPNEYRTAFDMARELSVDPDWQSLPDPWERTWIPPRFRVRSRSHYRRISNHKLFDHLADSALPELGVTFVLGQL